MGKVLLTLGILVAAILIGAVIAKLVSIWYNKRVDARAASASSLPGLDATARSMVHTRLAIMQFKRQKITKEELTEREIKRRLDLGIWSYNGGTSIGPLKAP